ncbi:SMI1/KNR4 family protein [Roseateles sp.]|uniref:SMI1/KNR4 family protein n=1 Tax=Roseateles sp. TaxID=1971397 RepID=UPI002F3F5678
MAKVEAFQVKNGVALPADVLAYLMTVDGSSDGHMDVDLFRFWPLGEFVRVHEELDERGGVIYPDRFAYPDCFVFADYLVNSWLYAVKLTADSKQPAPVYRVTASDPPGEQMSASFKEFMANYAAKPSSIV